MRSAILISSMLAFSIGSPAQQAPAQLSATEVRAILDRMDQLEKRVAELEAREATTQQQREGASALSTPDPAHDAHVDQEINAAQRNDQTAELNQPLAQGETYPSLKIRGFADVNFAGTDEPGAIGGFSMGQFVLHFVSPLSRKITYFGEVSLSAQPGLYNVDLERSFIRYDVNDSAKISFGRYHTPINYWNTAFHHGAWLQTTISRPDMIHFGGTFEPVHFVGAQSEGHIPSGGVNLGYNVAIGNGRGSLFSRAGDTGDVNNNRAWLVNVFARPSSFKHLQVGGSYYRDVMSTSDGVAAPDGRKFGEWIAAGHLAWTSERPEVLAEFANVRHRSELTGRTFDSQGGYIQLAYRIPAWKQRWKPYFRYDYIQVPTNEPLFGNVNGVRGATLGTRYDISDFAALKAEYRNRRGAPGQDRINSVVLQTAFTF